MSVDVAEAANYLKFTAARVRLCQNQFHASRSLATEVALANLRHLHTELSEAVGRLCPEGQNVEVWSARYSDGRPVISVMPIDDTSGVYVHVWHPDPTHPMNSRCELEVVTTPKGSRKQTLVTAPGVIDAVSLPEIAAAGGGQPVPARTASKED